MSKHDLAMALNLIHTCACSSGGFIGLSIADQWTHPFGLATQNRRQLRRQIVEGYAGTQQDIQHRLLEKRKRRHEAPAARPPRAVRWRDASDLAGYEPQAPTVERLAEARRDIAGSIPAQLDDGRLLARKA